MDPMDPNSDQLMAKIIIKITQIMFTSENKDANYWLYMWMLTTPKSQAKFPTELEKRRHPKYQVQQGC